MSIIDRQRIEAVRLLERLGYRFTGIEWAAPAQISITAWPLVAEADVMHALLTILTDKLSGSAEGSQEATELRLITAAVTDYEAKRWPDGRVDGGKG